MRITLSAYLLPHIGDKYSQCADRFCYDEANKCFAIADGVGNSLFPAEWASLLCKDFVEHPMLFVDNSKLVREDDLVAKWEELRSQRISNLSDDEKFIYEMGLEKADFAASTFVGLSLDENGWGCQAIGDSYLFVVDKSYNIKEKVASMDGREFDNYPEYLGSKKGQNNGAFVSRKGTYDDVAFFVLMTDALSDWFIETSPENKEKLLNTDCHSDFEKIVDAERQKLVLKDDDTTMVLLKVEQDANKEISVCIIPEQVDNIESLIAKEEDEASSNDREMSCKYSQDEKSDADSKQSSPSDTEVQRMFSPSIIGDEIEKIAKEYHQYSNNKLKKSVKKLLSYINHLLIYGTSN